jgi:hypothetical protein
MEFIVLLCAIAVCYWFNYFVNSEPWLDVKKKLEELR